MQKVEDGFGYYGAITQTNDGLLIQCHLCGYYFGNLGAHVSMKHNEVGTREYKIRHGLRINDGLLSPEMKFRAQTNYNTSVRKTPEEWRKMSAQGHKARIKKGSKVGGNNWNPQRRNEQGRCREQTLAKIRNVAETNNGVATYNEFIREYGKGEISTVVFWFGSWSAGIKEAGVASAYDAMAVKREELKDTIVDSIAKFYKENGRTPSTSDFRSTLYLPTTQRVSILFGSLNAARVKAGVPIIVYVRNKWVEVQPGKETNGIVPSFGRRRGYLAGLDD